KSFLATLADIDRDNDERASVRSAFVNALGGDTDTLSTFNQAITQPDDTSLLEAFASSADSDMMKIYLLWLTKIPREQVAFAQAITNSDAALESLRKIDAAEELRQKTREEAHRAAVLAEQARARSHSPLGKMHEEYMKQMTVRSREKAQPVSLSGTFARTEQAMAFAKDEAAKRRVSVDKITIVGKIAGTNGLVMNFDNSGKIQVKIVANITTVDSAAEVVQTTAKRLGLPLSDVAVSGAIGGAGGTFVFGADGKIASFTFTGEFWSREGAQSAAQGAAERLGIPIDRVTLVGKIGHQEGTFSF
ncbi:MAG: hypothetical protein ABIK89_25815, partial [Planctomycetota bacterium]